MKIDSILNKLTLSQESTSTPLVVIDVQPGHRNHSPREIDKILDYVIGESYKGRSIYFVHNGPDLGFEDSDEVRDWIVERCMDTFDYDEDVADKIISNFKIFDKSYAFLRNWMDKGLDHEFIVSVLKYMIKNKVNDSRDFDLPLPKEIQKLVDKYSLDEDDVIDEDSIYIHDIINVSRGFPNNFELVGGGKDECLAEMELVFQAIGKKYRINNRYVY